MTPPVSIYDDPQTTRELQQIELEDRTFVEIMDTPPAWVARDGQVFHVGDHGDCFHDEAFLRRMLARYRRASTDPTDWFAPFARKHAADIEAAMREAGMEID